MAKKVEEAKVEETPAGEIPEIENGENPVIPEVKSDETADPADQSAASDAQEKAGTENPEPVDAEAEQKKLAEDYLTREKAAFAARQAVQHEADKKLPAVTHVS